MYSKLVQVVTWGVYWGSIQMYSKLVQGDPRVVYWGGSIPVGA